MKNILNFNRFESNDNNKNLNLSLELANLLRNNNLDSNMTVDDFFDKFNVPKISRSDYAFSSILKNADIYFKMTDSEFEKTYQNYLNGVEVNSVDIDECEHCHGTKYESCPSCAGNKTLSCELCGGIGYFEDDNESCSSCSGMGETDCITCDGSGMIDCTECII